MVVYHKNKKIQNKIVLKKIKAIFLFKKGAKNNANILNTNNIYFNLNIGISRWKNKKFGKKNLGYIYNYMQKIGICLRFIYNDPIFLYLRSKKFLKIF